MQNKPNQNIKPGDMCIVVGNCRTPGLSGRVVEVVREYYLGEGFTDSEGRSNFMIGKYVPAWVCKSGGYLPWILSTGEIRFFHERAIDKVNLIKISDPDIDISETEDIQIEKTKELENTLG